MCLLEELSFMNAPCFTDHSRYSRQMRFGPIGEAGQAALGTKTVLLCGCGALGTVLAETLVRAGVGRLRIVDRDFVELSNLQRQVLFTEADVLRQWPKAMAAAEKLREINRQVVIEPHIAELGPHNATEFAADADLLLDGTDNFETRFLLNDMALEYGIPFVHGGCVGSSGQVLTIRPGITACFRCLVNEPPRPGEMETCDTAGVLAPAIQTVAALQTIDVLKLLTGQGEQIPQVLQLFDLWTGQFRQLQMAGLREKGNCPACVQGERTYLRGAMQAQSQVLCGRNAVQISPGQAQRLVLADLARALEPVGRVVVNPFLLRVELAESPFHLTVFGDGRTIVQGTDDVVVARSVCARVIGM